MTNFIMISPSQYYTLKESGVDTIVNLGSLPCHVSQITRDSIFVRSNDGKKIFRLISQLPTTKIEITDKKHIDKRAEFLKSVIGIDTIREYNKRKKIKNFNIF